MKVTPVAGPAAIQPQTSAGSTRDAVVAKLAATMRAPEAPINQNQVTAEDMVTSEIDGQNSINEDVVSEDKPQQPVTELETKAEEPKAQSAEYLRLVRAEKALRAKQVQQEQAWKAREQALAAREAELAAKDSQYKTGYISKDTLKQNALQVLAEAGVSYEELTQQVINQTPVDPRIDAHIQKLEEKLRMLEEANENNQKSVRTQQEEAYKAAVQQIETDTRTLVSSDPSFELIKATGSIKDVVQLIEQTYKEEGRLMTVEEAAKEVEDHLEAEIDKLTKIQKIQKRWQAASTPPAVASTKQSQGSVPTKPQPAKTLTNTMASTRQLSAKERAIAAFKGELK